MPPEPPATNPPIVAVRLVEGCIRNSHPLGTGVAVDVDQLAAWPDAQQAWALPLDAVQAGHVEDDPAVQRHGLAVIARAAAACRDRHLMAKAGGGHAHHVGLVRGLTTAWAVQVRNCRFSTGLYQKKSRDFCRTSAGSVITGMSDSSSSRRSSGRP